MKNPSLGPLVCLVAMSGCDAVIDPDPPAPPAARVRVAHLSPDAPAVDFCIAPAGTQAFAGPVLAGAGAPLGISYANVTRYLDVEAIRYDVRLVSPGAADCSRALLPDVTDLPELPAGASATIAATGKLEHDGTGEPFAVRAYLDDASVAAGQAKLRFVHASPGTPAVDVGLGVGHGFQRVFAGVSFGGIGTNAPLDALGFVEASPFTAPVTARLAGSTADALTVPSVTLAVDQIATAFAIGNKTGQTANPLRVLLCSDRASAGLLTACVTAP